MYKIVFSMLIILSTMSTPCSPSAKDTVQTQEDYLTSQTWLIKEITFLQYDQFNYYKKDSYSDQFLNDRISFKKGGTGVYTNTYNQEFQISWQFKDEEKKKITLVIKDYSGGGPASGKNQLVNLENVNVTSNSLRYSEIYSNNGHPTMSSVYRVPVNR